MQWMFLVAAVSAPPTEPVAWTFRAPPIIEVSRERIVSSVEPPLLEPIIRNSRIVQKSCQCSPLCVCGCNEGRACQCQTTVPANLGGLITQPQSPVPSVFAGAYGAPPVAEWARPAPAIFQPPVFQPLRQMLAPVSQSFSSAAGGRSC